MSNQASEKEVVEGKLKTALKLIKQKRYAAARQILREFPDNPKARAMLQHMEGKTEKRRGFSAISRSTLLMVGGVSLVLCTLIGMSLLFFAYFSQYSIEELFVLVLATIGDEDAAEIAVAINYCKVMQDFRPDTCSEWPLQMITDYPSVAQTCFSPFLKNFFLEDTEVIAIRDCLRSFAAPRTY